MNRIILFLFFIVSLSSYGQKYSLSSVQKNENGVTISLEEKQIEQTYKELMKSGTHEDLVKIIKTTYLRNQMRILNNKKISEKDDEYFKRAEKYLW